MRKHLPVLTLTLCLAACGAEEERRRDPEPHPPASEPPPAAQTHAVQVTVAGEGRVRLLPGTQVCAAQCSASFAAGTPVTLVAEADSDWKFTAWSGDCAASLPVATVVLDKDRICAAVFAPNTTVPPTDPPEDPPQVPSTYKLRITRVGEGRIKSTPAGIDCGTACELDVPVNAIVTLQSEADPGYDPVQWTGGCAEGPIFVTREMSCTATFAPRLFSRAWGTAGEDWAIEAALPEQEGAEGYYLAGSILRTTVINYNEHTSADAWIARVNGRGELAWQKAIGGSGYDRAGAVAGSGYGCLVAGTLESSGVEYPWVAKLDSEGSVGWQKTYTIGDSAVATTIVSDTNGGAVVGGTAIKDGDRHAWVMFLNSRGETLWGVRYDRAGSDEIIRDLVFTSDWGVGAGSTGTSAVVVKIDGFGVLWQRAFASTSEFRTVTRVEGGYVAAGSIGDRILVVRLDENGAIVWQKTYGAQGQTVLANAARARPDGTLVVAGFRTNPSLDGLVLGLDASGGILWQKRVGGSGNDLLYAALPLADGRSLLVGETASAGQGQADVWAMMLPKDGSPVLSAQSGLTAADAGLAADTLSGSPTDPGLTAGELTRSLEYWKPEAKDAAAVGKNLDQ